MTTKSTKLSLLATLRGPSVNRKDLQALTLVEPTRNKPALDPLAVLQLNNRLSIFKVSYKMNFFMSLILGYLLISSQNLRFKQKNRGKVT